MSQGPVLSDDEAGFFFFSARAEMVEELGVRGLFLNGLLEFCNRE